MELGIDRRRDIGYGEVDGSIKKRYNNRIIDLQTWFSFKNYSLAPLGTFTGTQQSDLVLYTS